MNTSGENVTRLLQDVKDGRDGARASLLEAVYAQLHQMARSRLPRSVPGDSMVPTALVNEVYIKLFSDARPEWANRKHFFFAAGRAMRDILVKEARHHTALKRGGGVRPKSLEDGDALVNESHDILALNDAMNQLEIAYPEVEELVTLRFFAGLSWEDLSQALGRSLHDVKKDWIFGRTWLHRRMAGTDPPQETKK